MNKKQLQESIMAGVRKAFSNNKALNEGFSDWREANVPKFDFEAFYMVTKHFADVLIRLMKEEQISDARFSIYNEAERTYTTVFQFIPKSTPESAISAISAYIKNLKDKLKVNDKVVEIMNKTVFIFQVPLNTYLWKYMESTTDGISNKIKDMEFIKFARPKENATAVKFYISARELMANGDKIMEYFN